MPSAFPEHESRHQVLNWALAGLMASLGLAAGALLQISVDESGGKPWPHILLGLVAIYSVALVLIARKERRLRLIHESLVAHLRAAVEELRSQTRENPPAWLGENSNGSSNDTGRLAEALAGGASEALRGVHQVQRLHAAYLAMLEAVAKPLGGEDTYEAVHGEEVAKLAGAIGKKMGLAPVAVADIRQYGRLFDYGKLAIASRILQKPEPLTAHEWELARQHVELSEEILRPLEPGSHVLAMVRHHHERWDGKGYPDGLRGTQIPLMARILCVADAYHALVSVRPYARSRSADEALAEIEAHSGSQFDPNVVKALAAVLNIPARVEATA